MRTEKKKTFTYATKPSIHEKAFNKAAKEGVSLSEKIDAFLTEYVKPRSRKVDVPPVDIRVGQQYTQ